MAGGMKIEVPKFPKMGIGGIIDSYTKEQTDKLLGDKLDTKTFEALGLSVVDGKLCITYEEG